MSASEQLRVRAGLVEALRYDLIGPMREDEVLEQRPTRWYLGGFLVSKGTAHEEVAEPQDNEELSNMPESDAEDDAGDGGVAAPRAFFPSSLGLSVVVGEESGWLEVWAAWGEYRVLEAAEQEEAYKQHRPEQWRKWREEADRRSAAAVGVEAGEEGSEAEEGEGGRRLRPLWRREGRRVEGVRLPLSRSSSCVELPGTRGVRVRCEVRPALARGLPEGAKTVSVFLVNERAAGVGSQVDAGAIFQAQLGVMCEEGLVSRTAAHQLGSEDFDEARTDLQYREHGEWVVGHNVSASARVDMDGEVREVWSEWLPRGVVRPMKAHEIEGVPVSMEALAELGEVSALRAGVAPLLAEYVEWAQSQRTEAALLEEDARRGVAEALLRGAERARARIEEGVRVLEGDAQAWQAFRWANRAMAMAARRARPDEEPRWRLFQLAFLLLNVAGVADEGHVDRGVVELLFFPTGGGKTEAYLGVAAFAMLLRRLRGVSEAHEGAGVAVLLRYTLRMLTLDQLGRAATLVCALEMLRRENLGVLGGRRFLVGLWVGKSATPNRMQDAEKQLSWYKANPQDRRRAPPMPLAGCPWCQREFGLGSYAIRTEGAEKALRVSCLDEACAFHADPSESLGVPVVVVDDQIYRELPSFLVATVDKFAGVPWLARTGALMGRVRSKDAHGFYGEGEGPKEAARVPGGLWPPELIIQDELHLITGPLGTMVGLYETLVGELSRGPKGARPKVIASTATARGAAQQIRAIYGAQVVDLFPPPGLDPNNTFFARADEGEGQGRLYLGVAAPGRTLKALAVRVYSALLCAAYKEWRKGGRSAQAADTYMTLLGYFNTLRDLGGALRLVQEEVSPRAARLSDRRPFQEASNPHFQNRSLSFDPLELTSRQTTDQIRAASVKLRAAYSSEAGQRSDVALASSMISVGVDIPRLGLMVVNGQPKTVAEYIQATSRVGRKGPGLVVTLLNLRRPRDRSHYERFESFHTCFYRMVEAASVTPFSSRALDRGLAGVVVGLARHQHRGLRGAKGAGDVDQEPQLAARLAAQLEGRVGEHASVSPDLVREVGERVVGLVNDWSQIAAGFKQQAVPLVYSHWETQGGEALLSTAVDPPSEKDPRLVRFQAPTSMRDVEPGVHLWTVSTLGGDE
jgi:hypothetical protein